MTRTAPARRTAWLALDLVVILVTSAIVLPGLAAELGSALGKSLRLGPKGVEALVQLLAISVQEAGLIILTLASVRLGYRRPLAQIGVTFKGWVREGALGLAAVLPLFVLKTVGSQVGQGIARLFVSSAKVAQLVAAENGPVDGLLQHGSPTFKLAFGIILVLVAPVAEEIFFRGFICEVFRERFGSRGAIVASALIFAAIHLYLVQYLPVFLMGLGLAWLYETRKSLVPSTVAHILLNLFAVFTLMHP